MTEENKEIKDFFNLKDLSNQLAEKEQLLLVLQNQYQMIVGQIQLLKQQIDILKERADKQKN